jgi:invasion protein IalB
LPGCDLQIKANPMMKITNETLIGTACALVLGLLLGWAGRGLFAYPVNSASETVYQAWRLVCPAATLKDSDCQISGDLMNNARQTLVHMAITREKGKLVMGITVPLGVSLPPGLGLKLGTATTKYYDYRTCAQEGCIVLTPLDDKTFDMMAKAKDASFIVAAGNGKPVTLPFKMDGFPAAQRAFVHNEKRRTSWFWRMWS